MYDQKNYPEYSPKLWSTENGNGKFHFKVYGKIHFSFSKFFKIFSSKSQYFEFLKVILG